jgi:hypothetical protein
MLSDTRATTISTRVIRFITVTKVIYSRVIRVTWVMRLNRYPRITNNHRVTRFTRVTRVTTVIYKIYYGY